jgi:hypothetical protein
MIQYVEQRGELRGHGDVPDSIREDIYGAERERQQRQQKGSSSSICVLPSN